MLNVLITHKNIDGRKLEGNGYVYGFNCGDGFASVYLSPESSSCIQICTAFCISVMP